jgi:predicted nucleic acid-binding protein
MKAVLDTNIPVSGLLSPHGPPGWIVEALLAGELQAVFCAAILDEYADVLQRPELAIRPDRASAILQSIEADGQPVICAPWPKALPDPDDGVFLAAAAVAGVPLVTGNVRHFPAAARGGVLVLTPREFAQRYA